MAERKAIRYQPPVAPTPPAPAQTPALTAYEWATWDPTGVNETVGCINDWRERTAQRVLGPRGYQRMTSLADLVGQVGTLPGAGIGLGAVAPKPPSIEVAMENFDWAAKAVQELGQLRAGLARQRPSPRRDLQLERAAGSLKHARLRFDEAYADLVELVGAFKAKVALVKAQQNYPGVRAGGQ